MNARNYIAGGAALALILAAGTSLAAEQTVRAKAPPPAPVTNNAPAKAEVPVSTFVIPSSPREGRNPFFPNSSLAVETPRPVDAPIDVGAFVLNGITSPPKRTAMINGRTFEKSEEGEVRMTGGAKALIKCVDITDEGAVIEVNGQRRKLSLRPGL